MGFPVPIHKWLGGNFKNFAKEILLSDDAKSRGIYNASFLEKFIDSGILDSNHREGLKLWALLNLELWFKKYIDKTLI